MSDRNGGVPSSVEEVVAFNAAEVTSICETVRSSSGFSTRTRDGRWSIQENVDHLRLAVRPLNWSLALPQIVFRAIPGRRQQRDYPRLRDAYQARLARGARATVGFVPHVAPVTSNDETRAVEKALAGLQVAYETFGRGYAKLDDLTLDQGALPHPILGLLTWREMGYFVAYHLSHHHDAIRRVIAGRATSS